MKATATPKRQKTHGLATHVTPAGLARRALLDHAVKLGSGRDGLPLTDPNQELDPDNHGGASWRITLAARMSDTLGTQPTSVIRRIHDIMVRNSRVSSSPWIEAAMLACDVHPDRDARLPTLPGNRQLCREMAECYIELHPRPKLDVKQLTQELWAFSTAVMDTEWPAQPDDLPVFVPDEFVLQVNNLEFIEQIKELTSWPPPHCLRIHRT